MNNSFENLKLLDSKGNITKEYENLNKKYKKRLVPQKLWKKTRA